MRFGFQPPWKSLLRRSGNALCVLLFWTAAFPCLSIASPREFLLQRWTRDEGLPGSTAAAVAQTPDGYLWIGTTAGLARFDGVRFTAVDLRRLAGAQADRISSLYVTRDGALWASTDDGLLVRFLDGRFTRFVPPSQGTPNRPIRRLVESADSSLWALNYEGLLTRLSGDVFHAISHTSKLTALASDGSGGIWVASDDQLLRWATDRLEPTGAGGREEGFQPKALQGASAGGCWVVLDGKVQRFEGSIVAETRALPEGVTAPVSDIVEDREGNLWLATYGDGVVILGKDKSARILSRAQGLPSGVIRCLFKDTEDNFWAGTEGKGLVRIRRSMFASYGIAEGLSGETVLCMCEGADGEVWVGTNGDGIKRILPNGQVMSYGQNEGLSNLFVWALSRDRSGMIRAGTWGGGLFRFQDGKFISEDRHAGSIVRAMHEDRQGVLWTGFQAENAPAIYSFSNGVSRAFELSINLPRISVHGITETRDGSIWLLTEEAGLLRKKENRFTLCNPGERSVEGRITAFAPDRDRNALWIAMAGVGLVLWENESFTTLPGSAELPEDRVAQITDDGLGFLWCGGMSGAKRLNKQDLLNTSQRRNLSAPWPNFSRSDGLPANECSGAGIRTSDGRVWFLTSAGVAVVDPQQISMNAAAPRVLIEEMLVAGKPLSRTSTSPAAPQVLSNAGLSYAAQTFADPAEPLKIPPGSMPIEIHFTASSLTAPERIKFRHQLVGLEEAPSEPGLARQARYSYLPPGHYTFKVSAGNEHGVWSEQWASVAFEVAPYFWQTLWFRILAAMLILGATAGTAQWVNSRRMRARVALLEKQRALEAERSRIAQDLHDDLGTSLTEISFLTAMAGRPSSSPEDVKNNLASIGDKSLELVKALDEIVWAVNPKNDSLRNLVNYLCLFAQEYLRPTGIQCRLDVPQGLPDLPLNADQRHSLYLVTKEALANAAKHSGSAEVQFRVRYEPGLLNLSVEDNGRGFDRPTARPGRNGLSNVETRMRQLGGEAILISAPGKGTRLEFKLPLHVDWAVLPNRGISGRPPKR